MIEECIKWAHQRKAFNKSLMDQPVIRSKLAHMVSQVEGVQNWLENVTHQMNNMSFADQQRHLAGPIALLKLLSTRYLSILSRCHSQLADGPPFLSL